MANALNETDTDQLGYGQYDVVGNMAKPHLTK
jgi:hypothetical protein